MPTKPAVAPGALPPDERATGGGKIWSWPEIRRGTPLRVLIDLVQYGVALVLLILAAVVLVRSFVDFISSIASTTAYTTSLISAIDGVLVVIILVDIMRTVLTHLEGWGFPFRPFLVIGIIAAVRDILAVSTRLTLNNTTGGAPIQQSLFELGTNAGVILILALALFLTRGQQVEAEAGSGQ